MQARALPETRQKRLLGQAPRHWPGTPGGLFLGASSQVVARLLPDETAPGLLADGPPSARRSRRDQFVHPDSGDELILLAAGQRDDSPRSRIPQEQQTSRCDRQQ